MPTRHHWLLWPGLLAAGPLTVAFVYFAHAKGWSLINRAPNEALALAILGTAVIILAIRASLQASPLYLLLGCFVLIAWLREWHFGWMHHGVYLMLLMLLLWTWLWRERITPLAREGIFMYWLKATFAIYFLSVLLARRAFRDVLPYEELLNTQLEETMENVAHTMLLITGLLGQWRTQPEIALQKSLDSAAVND